METLSQWLQEFAERARGGGLNTASVMAAAASSGFFLAEATSEFASNLLPEPATTPAGASRRAPRAPRTLEDYAVISSRNLFNSAGKIPGESIGTPGEKAPAPSLSDPPIRTTLPLNLIGTVILRDELRSIATIEDKAANVVFPVRVEDEIPSKLKVLSIEARRVTFVNFASNRREYIELPEEKGANPRVNVRSSLASGAGGKSGVEKLSPTQFSVSRQEIDKTLSDFNQVLTQARAVPHFENGQMSGYKLFQIVPGSIYEKLGLVNGDTLCGINGQPMVDPIKAMEMLGELKTSNHVELCVKRDGKQSNFAYDIH